MSIERAGTYNWGKHKGNLEEPVRAPRIPVQIDDETWRDGMQGTQTLHHPNLEQKGRYIEKAVQLGYVDHFDIGFPASGPEHRKEITSLIKEAVRKGLGVTFSAAGRSAATDDATSILEVANRTGISPPLRADLFLDPSSVRASVEHWDKEEKLKQTARNIRFLRKEGLPVMFVPERSSATPPLELFEACILAADAGADRIAIADTTGVLDPMGTQKIFREVLENVGKHYPEIKFDFHGHNDLGMGTANCIIAASEGADCLHATARGVGERAGNVKLEELLIVLNLQELRKIDSSRIQEFTKMAADILGLPIASHEPIVGAQATATASGVHASTYEKILNGDLPDIYFPFHPRTIGQEIIVMVGPFSSLANVRLVLKRLGIEDTTEEMAMQILQTAKAKMGILSDMEIGIIINRQPQLIGQ